MRRFAPLFEESSDFSGYGRDVLTYLKGFCIAYFCAFFGTVKRDQTITESGSSLGKSHSLATRCSQNICISGCVGYPDAGQPLKTRSFSFRHFFAFGVRKPFINLRNIQMCNLHFDLYFLIDGCDDIRAKVRVTERVFIVHDHRHLSQRYAAL